MAYPQLSRKLCPVHIRLIYQATESTLPVQKVNEMNNCQRSYVAVGIAFLALVCGASLFAAGGTSIVATAGAPAFVSPSWPDKVGELVNDPARTTGWNSWFTEWPNDVNQYGFQIATMDDVNRLVEKLAAVKAPVRQIRLSPLKEPEGLGWVTRLPKDNRIAVVFSIGDQVRIDEWYKHVRKPFGVMEFLAAPVAVPPTLTIFVQNDVVNLDKLRIPAGILINSGYIPTVFHRANTKMEKKQEVEAAGRPKAEQTQASKNLDPASQAVAERISAFLTNHNAANPSN